MLLYVAVTYNCSFICLLSLSGTTSIKAISWAGLAAEQYMGDACMSYRHWILKTLLEFYPDMGQIADPGAQEHSTPLPAADQGFPVGGVTVWRNK